MACSAAMMWAPPSVPMNPLPPKPESKDEACQATLGEGPLSSVRSMGAWPNSGRGRRKGSNQQNIMPRTDTTGTAGKKSSGGFQFCEICAKPLRWLKSSELKKQLPPRSKLCESCSSNWKNMFLKPADPPTSSSGTDSASNPSAKYGNLNRCLPWQFPGTRLENGGGLEQVSSEAGKQDGGPSGSGAEKRAAGSHPCDFCSKYFPSSRLLAIHRRRHTGERPYACAVCSSAFKHRGDLKKHTRKHTGERPYSCEFCDATFSDASSCSYHRRTHTEEKPHMCGSCGKGFIRLGDWRRHCLLHTEAKPVQCPQCGAAFNDRSGLRYHSRLHAHKDQVA